jgi:phage tail sheath protein FI
LLLLDFNRGGISQLGGANGPLVTSTAETLNKANRDDLYETNINPIARLQGDFVIFGQKTLQQVPSALDRINVRRLMIFVKKRIGEIADTILFDNNIEATWNRFSTRANRVLGTIQSQGGIVDYKVQLDSSTTTPDLQDRNILYAKVYIKPARAIEFIAVDFIITRSGVQF